MPEVDSRKREEEKRSRNTVIDFILCSSYVTLFILNYYAIDKERFKIKFPIQFGSNRVINPINKRRRRSTELTISERKR